VEGSQVDLSGLGLTYNYYITVQVPDGEVCDFLSEYTVTMASDFSSDSTTPVVTYYAMEGTAGACCIANETAETAVDVNDDDVIYTSATDSTAADGWTCGNHFYIDNSANVGGSGYTEYVI